MSGTPTDELMTVTGSHVFVDESKGREFAAAGHAHLCLDGDDTLVERDRRQLYDAVRAVGAEGTLRYQHAKTVTEPLLVVPDAVAWAYSKGGAWRALTSDVVESSTCSGAGQRETRAPQPSGRVSGPLPTASAVGSSILGSGPCRDQPHARDDVIGCRPAAGGPVRAGRAGTPW